jgi:hypothetical protein
LDQYLEKSYLPALHRVGIKQVGVFKPVTKDTADLRVYVMFPFQKLEQLAGLDNQFYQDAQFLKDGQSYINAAWNTPPYSRIESIILQAFPGMPVMATPALQGT